MINCPYCGFEILNPPEMHDVDERHLIHCEECKKPFEVERKSVVYFESYELPNN